MDVDLRLLLTEGECFNGTPKAFTLVTWGLLQMKGDMAVAEAGQSRQQCASIRDLEAFRAAFSTLYPLCLAQWAPEQP